MDYLKNDFWMDLLRVMLLLVCNKNQRTETLTKFHGFTCTNREYVDKVPLGD